jgi:hypothetical protein
MITTAACVVDRSRLRDRVGSIGLVVLQMEHKHFATREDLPPGDRIRDRRPVKVRVSDKRWKQSYACRVRGTP